MGTKPPFVKISQSYFMLTFMGKYHIDRGLTVGLY